MRFVDSEHTVKLPNKKRIGKIQNTNDPSDTPEKIITRRYYNEYMPHDFDICGDETIFFKFENGEYWVLNHSWERDYSVDDWSPYYEHEIKRLETDDPSIPDSIKMVLTRDWLLFS